MTEAVQIVCVVILAAIVAKTLKKAWSDGNSPVDEDWLT